VGGIGVEWAEMALKTYRLLVISAAFAAAPAFAQQYQQEPVTQQLLFDDFNETSLNTSVWTVGTNTIDHTVFDEGAPTLVNSGGVTYARFKFDTYDPNPNQTGQSFSGTQIQTNESFALPTGASAGQGIQFEARVKVEPTGLLGPAGSSKDTSITTSEGLDASVFSYTDNNFHDEIDFENLTSQQQPVGTSKSLNSNGATSHSNVHFGTSNGDGTLDTSFHTSTSDFGSGNSQYSQYPYENNDTGPTTPSIDMYQYNIYDIDWYPNQIDWYINGQLVRQETSSSSSPEIPNQPMPFYFNFWAPGSEFSDAGYSGLNPASSSAQNEEFYYDIDYAKVSQIAAPGTPITPSWTGGGSDGNWMTSGNWGGTTPVSGDSLIFAGTTNLAPTNNFPANTQFNGITFNSGAGAFVVMGNAINLGGNIVNNSTAAQTLNLNLALLQNTTLNAASGNLSIGGSVSGGFSVTLPGAGSVTFSGSNTYTGGTILIGPLLNISAPGALPANGAVTVGNGGNPAALRLTTSGSTFTVSSLTVNSGATVDIGGNTLLIDFGGGADPASTVRNLLVSGYNNLGASKWTGTGIVSSLAAANPASFAVGYADGGNATDVANTGVAAGEVEIKYTIAGDVNLNGSVDLSDLVIVASDFGQTGAGWAEGDVNYNGSVDLSDLVIIASNFGASLSSVQPADFGASFAAEWQLALAETHGADVNLPDPAPAILIPLGMAVLSARRRTLPQTIK
jgi:autotransporter-associated beta strand protein